MHLITYAVSDYVYIGDPVARCSIDVSIVPNILFTYIQLYIRHLFI